MLTIKIIFKFVLMQNVRKKKPSLDYLKMHEKPRFLQNFFSFVDSF